jgi:fluoride ion exporter CrcB/FEX
VNPLSLALVAIGGAIGPSRVRSSRRLRPSRDWLLAWDVAVNVVGCVAFGAIVGAPSIASLTPETRLSARRHPRRVHDVFVVHI